MEDDDLEMSPEYSSYIDINYNTTQEPSFNWTLTKEEKDVIEEIQKVIIIIIKKSFSLIKALMKKFQN